MIFFMLTLVVLAGGGMIMGADIKDCPDVIPDFPSEEGFPFYGLYCFNATEGFCTTAFAATHFRRLVDQYSNDSSTLNERYLLRVYNYIRSGHGLDGACKADEIDYAWVNAHVFPYAIFYTLLSAAGIMLIGAMFDTKAPSAI